MIKCKYFSKDFGTMLDVKHIDFVNNKFTVEHSGQMITFDNIDNVILDTGDEHISLSTFRDGK